MLGDVTTSTPSPKPRSTVTTAAGAVPSSIVTTAIPTKVPTPVPPTPLMTTRQRFYTAAAVIGRAPDELQYQADAWRRWGRYQQWLKPNDPAVLPTLTPGWEGSTMSVYPADKSTGVIWVWASATPGDGDGAPWDQPARWAGMPKGQFPLFSIPTGPGWKGAQGTTDQAYFVRYGEEQFWGTQGLRRSTWWDRFLISFRPGLPRQPNEWDWVCDGAGLTTPANAYSIEGSGAGKLPWLLGIVTADEVIAAKANGHRGVGHVMSVASFALETGPLARYVSPATRVEMAHVNNLFNALGRHPNAPDARLVMQGTCLASTLTESQIDARLATLYPNAADASWKATVKVWWMSLSEHGIMVGKTSGMGDSVIETTTMAPGYWESAKWASLGHTSGARNASVWNSYPWESLYVLNPAPVSGTHLAGT